MRNIIKSISTIKSKKKVIAYILREKGGVTEILLHQHKDFPEAGFQVPAGTIEKNESEVEALLRETFEESGLSEFKEIKKIGECDFQNDEKNEMHHRSFYLLQVEKNMPDIFEHIVSGNGEDADLVFLYEWRDIKKIPKLAAELDVFIKNIY